MGWRLRYYSRLGAGLVLLTLGAAQASLSIYLTFWYCAPSYCMFPSTAQILNWIPSLGEAVVGIVFLLAAFQARARLTALESGTAVSTAVSSSTPEYAPTERSAEIRSVLFGTFGGILVALGAGTVLVGGISIVNVGSEPSFPAQLLHFYYVALLSGIAVVVGIVLILLRRTSGPAPPPPSFAAPAPPGNEIH